MHPDRYVTGACAVVLGAALAPAALHAEPDLDNASGFAAPERAVVVPFTLEGDQPVLEIRVNGDGPFRFLFDTAAAGSGRVSAELAERFGLEKIGEVLAGDPSGENTRKEGIFRVDRLELGGLAVTDVPMGRSSMLRRLDDVDGVLGFQLFRDVLLTLDYPARQMRIERGELGAVDGAEILADIGEHGIPTVEMNVGGAEIPIDIDSGSMGWLMIPADVVEHLELAAEPQVIGSASTDFNTFDILQAPLDGEARLGRHTMVNPPIDFAGIFPRGNMGGQLLAHFAVTFDQRNKRVRFRRDDDAPIELQPRYRVGLMMVPEAGGLRVDGTVPGGPADRAGLKKGDVLLEMNGTPIDAMGPGESRKAFASPEPIALTILRADKRMTIELTPEKAGD